MIDNYNDYFSKKNIVIIGLFLFMSKNIFFSQYLLKVMKHENKIKLSTL